MSKFKILFINLFILSIAFSACQSNQEKDSKENDFRTIEVKNRFSIQIPSILKQDSTLSEDASLALSNPIKELYAIVIEDPKNEFFNAITENLLDSVYSKDLDGYSKLLKTGMLDNISEIYQETDPIKTTINGLESHTLEVAGKIEDVKIYYYVAHIKGKDTFYQIITWTLLNRKEMHKALMEKIVFSFKEL